MAVLLKAVQGHEIWILPEAGHGHRGHELGLRIFYGHAMHPDGRADPSRLKAWAVDPGGDTLRLPVEEGRDDCRVIRLLPEREGLWAIVAENDVGPFVLTKGGLYKPGTRKDYPEAREAVYYYQYAKTYLKVGHFCAPCGDLVKQADVSFLGNELEIVLPPQDYRLDNKVEIQVRYRGAPLPQAVLCAAWSLSDKRDWPVRTVTDAAGRAHVTLSAPGHWLFYVRHADDGRGVPGEYERRVMSATFSLYGVR
ncbi:MAG TPA: DUF4198 domain-containing protein [Desulfotomaculum sp.]|nr:DUF4198 domain-containing protein [Desulfotomaculum sp.]